MNFFNKIYRFALVFCLCFVTSLGNADGSKNQNLKVSLEELNSDKNIQVDLFKQKGPTLVLFWASWCHFCTNLAETIRSKVEVKVRSQFRMLAVSTDEKKSTVTQEVIAPYAFAQEFFWMNKNRNLHFELGKIPGVYLYSRSGDLDTIYTGTSQTEYMIKRMRTLVDED